MERMTAANPHFIRCIKPNNEKVPDLISAALVLLTGSCVIAIRACPKGIAHLKNEVKLVSHWSFLSSQCARPRFCECKVIRGPINRLRCLIMLLQIISGTVSAYTFDPVYYRPSRMFYLRHSEKTFHSFYEYLLTYFRVLSFRVFLELDRNTKKNVSYLIKKKPKENNDQCYCDKFFCVSIELSNCDS